MLSPAARVLVRETADQLLQEASGLVEEVNAAVAAYAPAALLEDPALTAEIERSNAAVLGHWLAGVLADPSAEIEPLRTPDILQFARDVARRGLEDMTFNYFRAGLGVASRHVIEAAFSRSSDPEVLREVLAFLSRSSSDYVDRSTTVIYQAIVQERAALASGARARRLEVARALLDGEPMEPAAASHRLAFEIDRPLLAAILWVDPGLGVGVEVLEAVARELAAAAGARAPLVVEASAASVWVWLAAQELPPRRELVRLVEAQAGVRAAFGSPGRGLAGFRASHQSAARTQRVMHRVSRPVRIATHEEVRVIALAGADEPAAQEFARLTLGPLADAPSALRDTVRAVLAAGFDTVAAARELGVHRNTVLARMGRARDLLPSRADAEPRWVDVALALELDHWLSA